MTGKGSEWLYIPKEPGFFKDLFEEYYPQLVRFAEAIVYDRTEAKDIVQEIFYKFWENAGTLRINSSIPAYLFTAVKNSALNHIQSRNVMDRNRERIKEAWLFSCHMEPEDNEELMAQLSSLIDKLPSQMKKILSMRLHNNLKYSEIADQLNLSKNTVKTHLRLAFREIRDKLVFIFF